MSIAVSTRNYLHLRKVSYQICLCSPHRLITDDICRFYGRFQITKDSFCKNPILADSVVPDYPVWTALAYLRRHFTQARFARARSSNNLTEFVQLLDSDNIAYKAASNDILSD